MSDLAENKSDNISNNEQQKKAEEKPMIVTPWDASGTIDYMKLVNQFGTEIISKELLERFQKVIGKELHPWLKRGIFFTHRAFNKFLDAYENGEPVFLYTGRGPSTDAMHIGHLIPFMFTKWMQETFNCPLVIQISDEEKAAFKHKPYLPLYEMGLENAKEIMSCGFDPKKTFIFSNREYRLQCPLYENFCTDLKNNTTIKSIQSIFGLNETGNVSMYDWPIYQSAAAFWQSYPHIFGDRPAHCCVPHAIDQDPYFRLARDVASKINLIKPTNIMCTFIPPLTGKEGKMSSSFADSTIFLNAPEEVIRKKIDEYCFSETKNLDENMAYQYLRYFEYDDNKLEEYKNGILNDTMSSKELKKILADKICAIVKEIQECRNKINKEVFDDFYKLKPIELPKPKVKEPTKEETELYNYLNSIDIKYTTKYHSIITTQDQIEEFSRSLPGSICKGVLLKSKEGYLYYIINQQTNINTKLLAKKLKTKSLRFAESDTYLQMLKVNSKTCPTPFSLINDKDKQIIKVLIDNSIPNDNKVNFLAMREDGTSTIEYSDMIKFVESLKYEIMYIDENN